MTGITAIESSADLYERLARIGKGPASARRVRLARRAGRIAERRLSGRAIAVGAEER